LAFTTIGFSHLILFVHAFQFLGTLDSASNNGRFWMSSALRSVWRESRWHVWCRRPQYRTFRSSRPPVPWCESMVRGFTWVARALWPLPMRTGCPDAVPRQGISAGRKGRMAAAIRGHRRDDQPADGR